MIIGLIGISGVGKSFLRVNAQKKFNKLNYLKSVTTRPQRIDETNGMDKFFVTDEEFKHLYAKREIVLEQTIYGYKYAFKKSDIVNNITYITEMLYSDVPILQQYTKVITINIFSRDMETIKQNLNLRYNGSSEGKKRFISDIILAEKHKNLALSGFFDYQFENNFDDNIVTQFNNLIATIL